MKFCGFLMAFNILLKYFSIINLLCIPILPPCMYRNKIPDDFLNFSCSQLSFIIYLISLNIILLELFSLYRISSALRDSSSETGANFISRSISFIFDLKYRFKFFVSRRLCYLLSLFLHLPFLPNFSDISSEYSELSPSSSHPLSFRPLLLPSNIEKALFLRSRKSSLFVGFNNCRDVIPSIIYSVAGFFSYEQWEKLVVMLVCTSGLRSGVIIWCVGFIDSIKVE